MCAIEAGAQRLTDERINCIIEAVKSTFAWATGEEPSYAGQQALEDAVRCEGVVACISLVGDIDWSLVVSLPQTTATPLAAMFAGFEVPFDSPDMGDAAGELANLIAGQAKVNLDGIGTVADISLPQVFRGDLIEVLRVPNVPGRLLRFESVAGPFVLAIAEGS